MDNRERRDGGWGAWCRGHLSFLLSVFASVVYLLTMDRSVSWWDCGEFITTGWLLQVGHPSGAPVYQLLSHLFMLLSFGHPMWVAPLSNAFSALCGGVTVGLIYATLRELKARPMGAVVGALCYLFCDTAWFSATESEVYALAMLFCALEVWIALRHRRTGDLRLLPLLGLLAGLGAGVHLMTLLVLPAAALVVLKPRKAASAGRKRPLAVPLLLAVFFFLLGLTPYAIIPIRAAVHPPINEGDPSTPARFVQYMTREQYPKAPLYPRMWRERDTANWQAWNGGRTDLLGNAAYCGTYQLGYMYGRYLMYNFIGRENLKSGRIVVFVLPFLLGLWGLLRHRRRSRTGFWAVMLLFLFGGVLLNLYLNHPCYEPRERDYAYVLSFYAFALWIGLGADEAGGLWNAKTSNAKHLVLNILLLLAPVTLAVGNWSDHDRSRCHSVHDIAANHLESCAPDAILVTLGDNDTFPLWYLQQVERRRTDVSVYNLGLTGWRTLVEMLEENDFRRPVYFSQYFVDRYAALFPGRLRCEGFCWRLLAAEGGDLTPVVHDGIEWHITPGEYLDPVSRSFLAIWEKNSR